MNSEKLAVAVGLLFLVTVGAGTIVHADPVHNALHADAASASGSFHAPRAVQGISLASDTPGQMWYFPANPAAVTSQVCRWLQTATPTTVHIPSQKGIVLADYLGPAELYFTDQAGRQVVVFPAHYLTDSKRGDIVLRYFPGVVAYEDGHHTLYLHSPELYRYLRQDAVWKSQFVMESYTAAQQKAIHAVFASTWGRGFRGFPTTPGVAAISIFGKGGSTPVYATSTTRALPDGKNIDVVFEETWANGMAMHTWDFVVSSGGGILRHNDSGKPAPLR